MRAADGGGAAPAHVAELSVQELGEMLAAGAEGVQCVDVREQWEHDTARLPGFKLMPLSQIQTWCVGVLVGSYSAWRAHLAR